MSELFEYYNFLDKTNIRTKLTHPYNYDPFIIWELKYGKKATGTVYTDRLYQNDCKKYDLLCEKYFNNKSQRWSDRDPIIIQNFLRDYFNKPTLILIRITEHCNQSTGYPLWRLDYNE